MSTTQYKCCTKCGQEYPETLEYFSKDKYKKSGISSKCKICVREISRNKQGYYEHDFERRCDEAKSRGYRVCLICKEEYPENAENFYKNKDQFSCYCKPCHQELNRNNTREWRQNNREYIVKKALEWTKNNPDKARVINARYRQTENSKQRKRISNVNRRARKRDLPNTLTREQWQQCLDYWDNSCCICGRKSVPDELSIAQEHWIALADKRENNPGTVAVNILPMCHHNNNKHHNVSGCNNSKRVSDPIEWLKRRLENDKAQEKLKEIEAYFQWVNAK